MMVMVLKTVRMMMKSMTTIMITKSDADDE